MTKIDHFRDEFAFLSNFHPSVISIDGKQYATVEHAYAAYKTLDVDAREIIRTASTPGKAKRLGRCVGLRHDWESVKVELMRDLVHRKFQNPFLRPMLMATGDAYLEEGNYWHDTFWGVYKGEGRNMLGQILMEIRGEIAQEEAVKSASDK